MNTKPILLIKVLGRPSDVMVKFSMVMDGIYPNKELDIKRGVMRFENPDGLWETLKKDYNLLPVPTTLGKDLYQFEVLNPSGEYDFEALKEIVMKAIEETTHP